MERKLVAAWEKKKMIIAQPLAPPPPQFSMEGQGWENGCPQDPGKKLFKVNKPLQHV